MFGPLKYLLYLFILACLVYAGLYIMPSFTKVEQIEAEQSIKLPKPQLVGGE